MRTLVTLRDPRPLVRAPAQLVAAVAGCGCGGSANLAKAMRALGVSDVGDASAWSADTWRRHMDEEEAPRGLFARLRAVAHGDDQADLDALDAQHAQFRTDLDAGKTLNPSLVAAHAATEDRLLAKYLGNLFSARVGELALAGMTKLAHGDVPAGVAETAPRGSGLGAAGMFAIGAGVVGGALLGGWPYALAGLAAGGGLAYTVLAPGGLGTTGTTNPHTPHPHGPIVDPSAYYATINQETQEIAKAVAERKDENDARVASWKKTAKYIPVIGDYAGYLIDLGAWLGKLLGSNYAEQNSPEDLQRAADGIAAFVTRGFVPRRPLFTVKDGAKNYADELDVLTTLAQSSPALTAMGNLTILHADCPAMQRAVADAAAGNGSLVRAGWYGSPAKLTGAESIMAGVAACEFGVGYDKAFQYALTLPATLPLADRFTATMQAASTGALA